MGAPDAFSYRDDPSAPPFPDDRPIVIFDGKRAMCSGFARIIVRHDRHRRRYRAFAARLGRADCRPGHRRQVPDPRFAMSNLTTTNHFSKDATSMPGFGTNRLPTLLCIKKYLGRHGTNYPRK